MAKAAQSSRDELWKLEWKEAQGEATIAARSERKKGNIILYCSWFCPFAQRAWIALEEKKVPYTYVEINPYEVDINEPGGYTKRSLPLSVKKEMYPGFVETSPRGLVPAIDHGGLKVWESLQVCEYLEDKFSRGHPSIMPKDAHQKALVRIWADHCTSRIQTAYYTMLMEQEGDAQEAAKQQLFEECRALARAMPPIGKDGSSAFFLGSQFSLVDIALAPFWQRMLWVGSYYRGLEFPTDEPEFKRLAMWWEAVRQRPSVAATLVCRQRLVSSYSQYSQNVATSDLAKSMWSSLSDLKDEAAGTEWPMAPALVLGAWLAACGAGVFFYFRHLRNAW